MYKCNYCEYISNNLNNVKLHSGIKHDDMKIDEDIKDTLDNDNKCDKCDKVFSTKSNLTRHKIACKGIINPFECQKCYKVFSSVSSKCRHTKICKVILQDRNPSIINNTTNNNNITNNDNSITNNIINNTYIFQSNPNIHPLAHQNYTMQTLSNDIITPNKNNLPLMMEDFGRLIYNDFQNKNIKKRSSKTKFCLVKNEKGEWCNKLDKDIIPKATKDIAYNFRIIIDNNEIELCNIDKKNNTIIPKLTEFLSIIIDYNHDLDILNEIDKDDDTIFSDMKDRTICIIIDSSNYE
jgi:hypothetical protein